MCYIAELYDSGGFRNKPEEEAQEKSMVCGPARPLACLPPLPHPPLSLGDGPIWTEILSQRAVKPQTINQPTNWWVSFAPEFQCYYFCESSCLFYLSLNSDFYVSKIMHL